jgi:hypothetical protein
VGYILKAVRRDQPDQGSHKSFIFMRRNQHRLPLLRQALESAVQALLLPSFLCPVFSYFWSSGRFDCNWATRSISFCKVVSTLVSIFALLDEKIAFEGKREVSIFLRYFSIISGLVTWVSHYVVEQVTVVHLGGLVHGKYFMFTTHHLQDSPHLQTLFSPASVRST